MRKFNRHIYNHDLDYVARRRLLIKDEVIEAGEHFPKSELTVRRCRQLFDSRKIIHAPYTEPEPVSDFVEETLEEETSAPEKEAVDSAKDTLVENENSALSDDPNDEDFVEETSETVDNKENGADDDGD